MEDVLDVYELPYNLCQPVVCMDEKPYQLLGESREPLPMREGSNQKIDSEYMRQGTCRIFVFTELLGGTLHADVRIQRTAIDWAEEIQYFVDVCYLAIEKIILVLYNLNTHTLASLYKAFRPEEARRIARRLEVHFTSKHGSWLNIVEIELNVMTKQYLSRRIDNIETLGSELAAWDRGRNARSAKIRWHFTNTEARTKMISWCPKIVLSNV